MPQSSRFPPTASARASAEAALAAEPTLGTQQLAAILPPPSAATAGSSASFLSSSSSSSSHSAASYASAASSNTTSWLGVPAMIAGLPSMFSTFASSITSYFSSALTASSSATVSETVTAMRPVLREVLNEALQSSGVRRKRVLSASAATATGASLEGSATSAEKPTLPPLTADAPTLVLPTVKEILRKTSWAGIYKMYHFGLSGVPDMVDYPPVKLWNVMGHWSISRNGSTRTDSLAKLGTERYTRWSIIVRNFERLIALHKEHLGMSPEAPDDDTTIEVADQILVRELKGGAEVAYEVMRELKRSADPTLCRPRFVPKDAHARFVNNQPPLKYDSPLSSGKRRRDGDEDDHGLG